MAAALAAFTVLLTVLMGVGVSPVAEAQGADPALELTKSVSNATPNAGETFSYTLLYRCAGITQNCDDVVITDVIPAELAGGAGEVTLVGDGNTVSSGYVAGTRTASFDLGDLDAGDSGQLGINVHFPAGTTAPGTVASNTATITAGNATTVVTPAVIATSGGAFNMTLGKSGPAHRDLGQPVDYTLAVCSPGSYAIQGGVLVDTLPTGATFVSSNQPAGVSAAVVSGDTVTWTLPDPWYPAGGYNTCGNFTIRVTYDTPTFADSQVVTNNAVLTGTQFPTNAAVNLDADRGTTLHAPVATLTGSKSGPTWFTPGQQISYTMQVDSTGNLPLSEVYASDDIPLEIEVTSVDVTSSGSHYLVFGFAANGGTSSSGGVSFPRSGTYSETPPTGPGEYVNLVRFYDDSMEAQSSATVVIHGVVRSTRPSDGSQVLDTDADVVNCATFTSDESNPAADGNDCVTTDIQGSFAQPRLTKSAPGGPFLPNATINYAITVANQSPASADLAGFEIIDLVDERLTFVAASAAASAGSPTITETAQGDGRTLIRWAFPGGYALNPGQSVTLSYQATVPALLEAGTTVPNRAAMTAYDVPGSASDLIYSCGSRTVTESDLNFDIDNSTTIGGATTYCATGVGEGNAVITGVPTMSSRKWVRGELDALGGRDGVVGTGGDDLPGPDAVNGTADDGYNRYPDTGRTLAGGRMDYRIIVTNESNVRIKDFVIVDVLPYVGDTATLSSANRMTEWRPHLMGPVSVAGFTVSYSTTKNPCRPEVNYSGGGCAAPNWTTTFPTADPASVTALKFVKNTTVAPAETMDIALSLRAQAHSSNGDIAWNSFAYAWTRNDTNVALLPSEPLKVGIEVMDDNRNGIGDRVWLDLDRDGAQDLAEMGWKDDDGDGMKDAGEVAITWDDRDNDGVQDSDEAAIPNDRAIGINGVLVELYNDTDADGPDATDVLVGTTYTHTDAAGYDGTYWFPNQPDGDYFVAFTPPAGYTVSPANAAGVADDLDSDGSDGTAAGLAGKYVTAATNLGPNDDDPTWDLGLWNAANTRTSLGNKVWYDSDADGVQDGGDGVAGVQVRLRTGGGTSIVDRNGNAVTTTTDSSGFYRFDWLIPGSYQVEFVTSTLPAGWRLTPADIGADDTIDSDANTSTGRTAAITLAAPAGDPNSYGGSDPENLVDPSWDAGITPTHSLGNHVWFDLDADGDQDGGTENPVGGVTVQLYNAGTDGAIGGGDDVLTGTATTDNSTGLYSFTGLVAARYFVVFTPPAGTSASPADATGDDATDSDGVTHASYPGKLVSAVTDLATLAGANTTLGNGDDAGMNDPTLDLGLYRLVSIGDRVWIDSDADGVQESGEPSLDGVNVRLYAPGATPHFLAGTTTAGGGLYHFDNLQPGSYLVAFQPPAGYKVTPNTGSVATTNSDVALRSTDLLDDDTTPVNLNGWALTPTVPRGTQAGTDARFGTADDVTADDSWDAGLYQTVSVGDRVWFDTDGDGIQNGGETGVAGIAVTLLDGAGNPVANPATSVSPWTVDTDSSGLYSFSGLVPGTYSVRFDLADSDLPGNWIPALRNGGSDDTADSDMDRASGRSHNTTLTSGQSDLTLDAGFVLRSGVGDVVWHDLDADGVQDAGEPGIANVSVELWSAGTDGNPGTGDDVRVTQADGVTVRPPQSTTSDGGYLFSSLLPGTYFVKVDRATLPTGYRVSPANAGADDAVDSDAVADPTNSARLMTGTAVIGVDAEILTLDTGVFLPATIGNRLWEDVDGDGIQDGGEPDLGVNAIVRLTDCNGATITTDVDGNAATYQVTTQNTYQFANIRPGTYCVVFDAPTGWTRSPLAAGADDGIDSDAAVATGVAGPTTLISDEVDDSWDAGYYRPAALGDLVWFDVDGDGTQDAGEAGAPGLTVRLLGPGGTELRSTVTGAAGDYQFTNLAPGTYTVCVNRTEDLWFSPKDSGSGATPDAVDSDVDRTTGCMAPVTLVSGDAFTTLDAGVYDDAELGDQAWEDRDIDGVRDSGEPAVANVRLVLGVPGADGLWATSDDAVLAEQRTAADGTYRFRGLLPGVYRVVADPTTYPTDMKGTEANVGTDDAVDSDVDVTTGVMATVTMAYGVEDLTWDVGLVTPFTLRLTKELVGTLQAGERATYRLTVTNDGPGTVWAGLTLTDTLPTGLSFVSATGEGWMCTATLAGDVVTCTHDGALASKATATVTLTANVAATATGTIINVAKVTSPGLAGFASAEPGASVAGNVVNQGTLARTGQNIARILLLGIGLVVAGYVLAGPLRRRTGGNAGTA